MMTTPMISTTDFAPAEPFRSHVHSLLEQADVHWRVFAALAEVSPTAISRLLFTRQPKIHLLLARALIAFDVDDVATAAVEQVSTEASRAHLDALHALGYRGADLDPWICPTARAEAGALSMSRLSAAHVSAGYDHVVADRRICPTVYSRFDSELAG